MRILVIDDDPVILEAIKIIAEELGYAITISENTKNLKAKINKSKPDLIFFDILLKGQNSCGIVKKLKNDPKYKGIPILLLSANNKIEKFTLNAKADGYLAKPFSIDAFKSSVEKFASI